MRHTAMPWSKVTMLLARLEFYSDLAFWTTGVLVYKTIGN